MYNTCRTSCGIRIIIYLHSSISTFLRISTAQLAHTAKCCGAVTRNCNQKVAELQIVADQACSNTNVNNGVGSGKFRYLKKVRANSTIWSVC